MTSWALDHHTCVLKCIPIDSGYCIVLLQELNTLQNVYVRGTLPNTRAVEPELKSLSTGA